jgi:hypothetical protein
MGLLKGLALLPLAPVEGVVWLAHQLQEEAERQLYDPEAIMAELSELQRAVDAGEISESHYLEMEEALLDRLEAVSAQSEQEELE